MSATPSPDSGARFATLFRDSMALAGWLHGRLGDHSGVLARQLVETALALVDALALALKGRERALRMDEADELLIALRIRLRLAAEVALLSEEQALFALEATDGIGRQLGGWMRWEAAL